MNDQNEIELKGKDAKRRDFVLNGDIWKVMFYILAPIALYNFINYLFGVFDLKIISTFSDGMATGGIVLFDSIKDVTSAFGVGFAVGATVVVANLFGEGKIREARINAGVVIILSLILSIGVFVLALAILIPYLNMPSNAAIVASGTTWYLYIQLGTTILTSINGVFIGLEKAKGNSKMILLINVLVSIAKVSITLFLVYGLNLKSTLWVALATLFAQFLLTVFAFFIMFRKSNPLRIDLKDLSFKKEYIKPMFLISMPVIFGRFIFSGGKLIINIFAEKFFGLTALAALGITYKANLGVGTLSSSTEEAEMTIISQNMGNKNIKRGFQSVWIGTIIAITICVVGGVIIAIFREPIVRFFIKPGQESLVDMASNLLIYEIFSFSFTALINVYLGGFYGFKLTKVAYIVNVIRLLVIRIPVFFLLYFVAGNLGEQIIGLTMVISNAGTFILVFVLFMVFFFKSKSVGYMGIAYEPAIE